MDKNCLVTKFKATVNNSNLPILGELILTVESSDEYTGANYSIGLSVVQGKSVDVYIEGDGTFSVSGNTGLKRYTLTRYQDSSTFVFSNGDYKVHITDKYNISIINFSAERSKIYIPESFKTDVKYLANLTSLKYGNDLFTSLSSFNSNSNLEVLNLRPNKVLVGSFSDIQPSLEELVLGYCDNFEDVLSNVPSSSILTLLNLRNTKVTGTLESLVAKMSGRTTGTIAVVCNNFITLNGSVVGNNVTKTYNFQTQTWN